MIHVGHWDIRNKQSTYLYWSGYNEKMQECSVCKKEISYTQTYRYDAYLFSNIGWKKIFNPLTKRSFIYDTWFDILVRQIFKRKHICCRKCKLEIDFGLVQDIDTGYYKTLSLADYIE